MIATFKGLADATEAKTVLREAMNKALTPIATLATEIERRTGWRYLGIDASPAPGIEASIGEAIELLTGAPFGAPSTLAVELAESAGITLVAFLRSGGCNVYCHSARVRPLRGES